MRTIVIVYCGLTLLFTGSCALLLLGLGGTLADTPTLIVTISALANAAFIWMARSRAPGMMMVAAGIVYAAVQCVLAIQAGLWSMLGAVSLVVLALFVIKGAVVVFAGVERRAEE